MGEYFLTVNLDKKEFLHPHKLGDGLKLGEQCGHAVGGVNDALHLLLADRGEEWIGRWHGDRIVVAGDYGSEELYQQCRSEDEGEEAGEYKDITEALIPTLSEFWSVVYYGDGWRGRISIHGLVVGLKYTHQQKERVAQFDDRVIPVRTLIEAALPLLERTKRGRDAPQPPYTLAQLKLDQAHP